MQDSRGHGDKLSRKRKRPHGARRILPFAGVETVEKNLTGISFEFIAIPPSPVKADG